jgi:hypothetical protein
MRSTTRLAIHVSLFFLILSVVLFGIPGSVAGQQKEAQKPKVGSEQPLQDIRKTETAATKRLAHPGEPVPGAEIYVELQNGQSLRATGVTDSNGDCVLKFKNVKKGNHTAKVFAVIGDKYFKHKGQLLKGKTDHLGTYHFRLTSTSGKNSKSHEFEMVAGKVLGQPKSMRTGGPYSQSLSNIEDNVAIVVHVALTAVNDYPITVEVKK